MDDRVVLAELLVVAAISVWLLFLIGHAFRQGRQNASSEMDDHVHAVPLPNNDVMSDDVRVCGAWVSEDGVRLLISILIRDGSSEALELAQDLAFVFLIARDKTSPSPLVSVKSCSRTFRSPYRQTSGAFTAHS